MLPFVSLSVCPSDAPGSKWCILCCGYYKTLEFCLIYWREKNTSLFISKSHSENRIKNIDF